MPEFFAVLGNVSAVSADWAGSVLCRSEVGYRDCGGGAGFGKKLAFWQEDFSGARWVVNGL